MSQEFNNVAKTAILAVGSVALFSCGIAIGIVASKTNTPEINKDSTNIALIETTTQNEGGNTELTDTQIKKIEDTELTDEQIEVFNQIIEELQLQDDADTPNDNKLEQPEQQPANKEPEEGNINNQPTPDIEIPENIPVVEAPKDNNGMPVFKGSEDMSGDGSVKPIGDVIIPEASDIPYDPTISIS